MSIFEHVREGGVTEPGLYRMHAETYHADPCPEPSLSRSVAVKVLHKTPRHAWLAHPKLNLNFEEEHSDKFDLGSVAHTLLLNQGRTMEVLDYPDFRTKVAKEARDEARAGGKTAILFKDYERAVQMTEAARQQVGRINGCETAFLKGEAEIVIAWQDKDGIWCRTMVDWMQKPDGRRIVVYDYKTTGTDANPEVLGRHLLNLRLEMQFGFIERAIRTVVDPELKVDFRFVVQETEPPYMLSVVDFDEQAKCMGQKKTAAAIALWHRCMTENHWPGYPRQICTLETPGFISNPWFEREERDGSQFLFREDPFLARPTPAADGLMLEDNGA